MWWWLSSHVEDTAIEDPVLNETVFDDQIPQKYADAEGEKDNLAADKPAETKVAQDNVVVTAKKHNSPPSTSTVLTKTTVKEKPPLRQEPAHAPLLEVYEEMSVADLCQQYETRLAENRAGESALIALIKKKYEVCSSPYLHIHICWYVAPKLESLNVVMTWCLIEK